MSPPTDRAVDPITDPPDDPVGDRLAALPRCRLATLPTPFEPLRRTGGALGLDLWVKRDDLTGLGLGGNKVRKLELLLGDAVAGGADTVVTFGALQSNHARQTAAACAREGLRCVLVLTRSVPRDHPNYVTGGNLLLDRLFGAEVVVVDPDRDAVDRAVADLRQRLAAEGRTVRWVPVGGSDAVGAAGYVLAGRELAADARRAGVDLTDVVVASSSGGTQAGLLLGLRSAGCAATVHGVAVYADAGRTAATVRDLLGRTAALLGTDSPPDADVRTDDRTLGPGYGLPTAATVAAVTRAARDEGLLLDPVYSGRAFEHLLDLAASGGLASGAGVAFVHTGGAPALFAYDDVLAP